MKKDDIEGLKQKLIVYKQTLETMKSGNVVEDYLIMKNESYKLLKQILKIENDMETVKYNHDVQITNIFEQVDALKKEIKSLDLSIENVKQKVMALTDKVNGLNFDEIMLKMEMLIRNEDNLATTIKQEKKELEDLKDEIIKLKSEVLESNNVSKPQLAHISTKIKPTSYQQLKKIIQSSSSQKILSEFSEPFRKDTSNFYQSVLKKTQKASFFPPTSPKSQKIELVDQIKETTQNMNELKEAETEPIDVLNETEEKPLIVSYNTNIPSPNDPPNSINASIKNISPKRGPFRG